MSTNYEFVWREKTVMYINTITVKDKKGTFPDNMKYADSSYVNAYWMMRKLGI